MFTIVCENCGGELVIDEQATIDEYLKDADYLIEKDSGKLITESIQQYLIYRCLTCNKIYKYTYKEWEAKYREKLAIQVMEIRKQKMFAEEINPQLVDPDNGLEFCGQCSGYAGDGYCLVDIIKQCTIRKR